MMPCYNTLQLLLATFLFFLSSPTFISFSHGDDLFPPPQAPPLLQAPTLPPPQAPPLLQAPTLPLPPPLLQPPPQLPGGFNNGNPALEGPISEPYDNSLMVLAAARTNRKDPLDGFRRYTGGWDIRQRHYWSSVGFTAAPLFATAAIWFLGFGICLFVIFLCRCCRGKEPDDYSPVAHTLSLIFLMIFTIASIIGCIVLYAGQGKFHQSTSKALDYVVSQADGVVGKLNEVSGFITSAKATQVDKVFVPSSVQTDIDLIGAKLSSSAGSLASQTKENSDDIQHLLDSIRASLIAAAAVMLVLTILGCIFSIFGMQFLVYIVVIIGWILVTGTFILAGTFFLIHNVAGDTCVAMDEWVQYPIAHTTLDEILPCVDSSTVQETVQKGKEVTYQLVEVVNQVITNVSNLNFSPNFPTMYINQSGPLVPILCNPFHADLTDRACSKGEVDLNNATEVWKDYVCDVSAAGICITTGRLTPTFYSQMLAAVNVSNGLREYTPFLVELEDCSFVRQTFSDISAYHCPGLRRYSKLIYVGLVIVSAAAMLSLIFWFICARERRQHAGDTKESMVTSEHGIEEHKSHQ